MLGDLKLHVTSFMSGLTSLLCCDVRRGNDVRTVKELFVAFHKTTKKNGRWVDGYTMQMGNMAPVKVLSHNFSFVYGNVRAFYFHDGMIVCY